MDAMNVALADQDVETGIMTQLPTGIFGRHLATGGSSRWSCPKTYAS